MRSKFDQQLALLNEELTQNWRNRQTSRNGALKPCV